MLVRADRFSIAAALLSVVWGFCNAASAADYYMGSSEFDPRRDDPLIPSRIYDGRNAEQVDEFLRRVPANSAIHFDRGVFETHGIWDNWLADNSKGFRIKSGWTIGGKGTNSLAGTVFKLVDVPVDASRLYNVNVVFSTGGIGLYQSTRPMDRRPNVEHVTIRDLQIDCNYQALAKAKGTPALQLAAIQILGNRNVSITNVLVRNGASRKVQARGEPFECFQVYLYNPWAPNPPGAYWLDRIAIVDYQGGYTSAICVNGNATGHLQNCTIDLSGDTSQRYGLNFAAGLNRFFIASNTVRHATRGINNDTDPICTDVTIVGNQLLDCRVGMLLANSQRGQILSNNIVVSGGGSGIALRWHPTLGNVKSGGCLVGGNNIGGETGEGISLGSQNEFTAADTTLYWSTNNIVQNNVISPGLQSKVPTYALAPNIVRPGNRRHEENYPACPGRDAAANQAAIGFPSDIGLGSTCTYCAAKAVNTGDGYISRFKISGTSIDMRSDWGDGSGYSDFTTGYPVGTGPNRFKRTYYVQWADLHRTQDYQVTVEVSGFRYAQAARFRVYIDLDHDGIFDPAREVLALGSSKTGLSGSITIPATAALGSTRLRVIMACGPEPTPCGMNAFWGEVEDYTVTIVP